MAGERHGFAEWAGADSVVDCTYTNSHGISPGIAVLVINDTSTARPVGFGGLLISDGNGAVLLPDCKVDEVKNNLQELGTEVTLIISDRRWRWRDAGAISGEYNQLDPNGKLRGWTIRSPIELAILCFQKLGEVNYSIDLPAGLGKADGRGVNAFVGVGVNFPPTGTNPPINWVAEPPAAALQRLCDLFGRRIVYDVITNSIRIVQLGVGGGLPNGSISQSAVGLKIPDLPSDIAIIGDPTKYQARFAVEPVGEDWDGFLRPINNLSYAPIAVKAQVFKSSIEINLGTPLPAPASIIYTQVENNGDGDAQIAKYSAQYTVLSTDTSATAATAVAAAFNASAFAKYANMAVVSNKITITAAPGVVGLNTTIIFLPAPAPNPNASIRVSVIQPSRAQRKGWEFAPPPLFPGVVATNRLTLAQAQALAQKTVWKVFRLTGVDVSGVGTINVPGYGRVVRDQQIHLLDTKVDQIVPEAADPVFLDKAGRPLILNYYNGFSHDKPHRCYGTYAIRSEFTAITKPNFAGKGANYPAGSQVFADSTIDPIYQTVTFSAPVYRSAPDGRYLDPILILETGCYVRDPETNSFDRYLTLLHLGGSAPAQAAVRSDVQLLVTAVYANNNRNVKAFISDADAINRANYYKLGLALQYQLGPSLTNTYNGIVPLACSGTVQQVTWTVGSNGAETVASLNTEHHEYVSPYPARRRAENLGPVQADKINAAVRPGEVSESHLRSIRS